MISRIVIFLAAVTVTIAVPHKSLRSRPNYDDVDYYDCSKNADGNYNHPTDCTRFITCHNHRAADMACPDCDLNNIYECAGNQYLVFNATENSCEWPRYTECGGGHTEKTTTEAPTSTTPPSSNGTEPCPFKEGDTCGENECRHCGYCVDKVSYFLRCARTKPNNPHDPITGVIVLDQCGERSWWNTELKPEGVSVGGACDSWDGLPDWLKNQYNSDPACNPPICEWGQDVPCTSQYWYFDPTSMPFGSRLDLQCQSGYIWDPSGETCRERADVPGC